MLQQIIIENFIRIAHLELQPTAPAILIAGPNESGKSSLAEAVRFAILGDNPRIHLKKEREKLIHNGGKNGSVTLTFDNATVRRSVRDGKVTGDGHALPTDIEVGTICLGASRLAELAAGDRRRLIMRLAKVDLSVDTIAQKLIDKQIPMDIVMKLRPLLRGGLTPAHEHVKRQATDARGQWKEVTGEVYGSQKAIDWAPPEPVIASEQAAKDLTEIDAKIAEMRVARDSALAPFVGQVKTIEEQLAKPDPLACPCCGAALLYEAGELKQFEGGDKKQLSTQLGLRKMKLQQLREEHDTKIQAAEDDKIALQEQVSASETAIFKKNRAKELHEQVQSYEKLQTLLNDGPDGIAAELISTSLKPLNDRLIEMGQEIGWTPVAILADMSIQRTDGYQYQMLSESAKWRADAMLHTLVSEFAGFSWLIFDRMDMLEIYSRGMFVNWLSNYSQSRTDEPTILVFATLKEAPMLDGVAGIEAHWLEYGRLFS